MKRLFLALLLMLCLAPTAFAEEAMTHIVFRYVSPKIKAGTFSATSRELWRVGFRYMRLQEQPDPQQHIHGLIIANAPNSWLINLYDNSGQHILDPGPSIDVHVQLFSSSPNQEVLKLEMGHEAAFFKKHQAKAAGQSTLDGISAKLYTLTLGESRLKLYLRPDGKPLQLMLEEGGESFGIRYELFEENLKPRWELFQPPKGIKITEAQR
jgi:hypothetical protein